MKLKYITIKNFRGIDNLEKLEVSNLNTLVGKNDSGKSIILKALSCFFNEKKFTIKDIFKGKVIDEKTIIELYFEVNEKINNLALDSNGMLVIKKEFSISNNKPKCDNFYLSNDFVDEIYQDLWNKKEPDLNKLISGLGEKPEQSGRGKTNLIRIEQLEKILNKNNKKEIYHIVDSFLDKLEKEYSIKLPEYYLFDAEEDLNIESTIFQSQFKYIISLYFGNIKNKTDIIEVGLKKNLFQEFEEIKKYLDKNIFGLEKLNPITDFNWTKSLNKFDINLKFSDQDFDIPISHKGTGLKRLLMVAYFEYLSNKEKVADQIFAIEEPETFLHPSAQNDLLNSIIEISKKSQFFITTHSPIFAGANNAENSVIVTKNTNGISKYERGTDHIIEKIVKELGINANYNLLENAEYIIFVEGKDDVQFLNIMADKLLNKNLEDDKIICLIGGGSSLSNYADLHLFKKITGNKYAVFIDKDNGDKTKQTPQEKIEAECRRDDALFYKISKREIENYCKPEIIKEIYIENIKIKEGVQSKNQRIGKIEKLDITIDENTDVNKLLFDLGLRRFKEDSINIKVFEAMSKKDFKEMDKKNEIENFINNVYSNL